jgi:hypothetical protein
MLFPLMLSVSHEFGIYFTPHQISNMIIGITISAGIFSTPTGILMKLDPNMFFYSLLAYSIFLTVLLLFVLSIFRDEASKTTENKSIELPEEEKI